MHRGRALVPLGMAAHELGRDSAPHPAHVTAHGVDLHYLEWPSAGPPLFLLHATGLLAALWAPMATRLSARFHVYAPDFPGHGDSARAARTYCWDTFAEDARAFIGALGLEQPRVLGHSMSATVAVLLAARYPDLVARLVLVEPVVMAPEVIGREIAYPGVPTAAGTRKRRAIWPDRASIAELSGARALHPLGACAAGPLRGGGGGRARRWPDRADVPARARGADVLRAQLPRRLASVAGHLLSGAAGLRFAAAPLSAGPSAGRPGRDPRRQARSRRGGRALRAPGAARRARA